MTKSEIRLKSENSIDSELIARFHCTCRYFVIRNILLGVSHSVICTILGVAIQIRSLGLFLLTRD